MFNGFLNKQTPNYGKTSSVDVILLLNFNLKFSGNLLRIEDSSIYSLAGFFINYFNKT